MWQCQKDDYKGETKGVCPEVVSTVPARDAINVIANKPITATFNETMNASTITSANFQLTQGTNSITGMKQAAVAIQGVVSPLTGETATYTFTPATPLAPFTLYTGTIKKGVKDPMNNMLQEDYTWSFTTQPLVSLSANPLVGGTISGGGLFNVGTTVTATVAANPGYVFANWTEAGVVVSTSALYPFELTSNRTLVANFVAQYNVAISSLPLLGGTTTGAGAYNAGTSVTITATPGVGYTFTNWTEGTTVVSALNTYTFPIGANRVLVANFGINMYMLNLIYTNGTVAKSPNQTTFSHGTSVLLTATPAVGYTFTSWSGDATGNTNPLTIVMNSEKTITANFTASQVSLSLSSLPLLGGTTTGAGSFNLGVTATAKATANIGYTFTNWTEGANIVSTLANYPFTITTNRTLVANFTAAVAQFTVGLTSNPLLGGTTTGSGSFNSGSSVTVGAVANLGYTFTNWTEGANIVSTNANYTFNITANKNLVANFASVAAKYTVALSSNPLLGGTTLGGGSFNSGSSVTIGAVANLGFTFTNWTEGANIVSTNANYTFNLTANKNLTANFTPVVAGQFLVDISANPLFGGSTNGEGLYNSGTIVNLTATPNSGFTFTNWTEGANIVSTNANYSFTISGNRVFVANFKADVIIPLGPAPVNLGTAGDFTALTKSGVSTTGVTSVGGNIGVSPAAASSLTGFGLIMSTDGQSSHTPIITGKAYASDYAAPTPAKMTTAVSDMETAFTTANNLVVPAPIVGLYAGDISGRTLVAGLYKWSSGVLITNAGVTLSGGPNDVWIFQIAQNLTVDNSAIVTLIGGAQAKNIFWVVTGQATLGTNTDFSGIILSKTLISLNTGARVTGRLLAQTAVTLNASTVVEP
jgi:uncharacterized repeat protein (TIGR02543 family)